MNRMRKIVSGATLVVVSSVPTVAPALALDHPTGQSNSWDDGNVNG